MPDYYADAAKAQQQFHSRMLDIRADETLTAQGRKRRIAELWLSHTKEIDRLKGSVRGSKDQRNADLEKKLFGPPQFPTPADTANIRDAMFRAKQIDDPIQAARLLKAAKDAGDTSLVRAIAKKAAEIPPRSRGPRWPNVINAYGEGDPALEKDMREYLNLNGPSGAFHEDGALNLMAPPKPAELADIPDIEHFVASN